MKLIFAFLYALYSVPTSRDTHWFNVAMEVSKAIQGINSRENWPFYSSTNPNFLKELWQPHLEAINATFEENYPLIGDGLTYFRGPSNNDRLFEGTEFQSLVSQTCNAIHTGIESIIKISKWKCGYRWERYNPESYISKFHPDNTILRAIAYIQGTPTIYGGIRNQPFKQVNPFEISIFSGTRISHLASKRSMRVIDEDHAYWHRGPTPEEVEDNWRLMIVFDVRPDVF